jgi:hypothetical protein
MVADLFRPLLNSPWRATALRSFTSRLATPETIYAASINQLKRLLLNYCIRCQLGLFSIFYHTAILYVVNALIHEAKTAAAHDSGTTISAEWRFYLDLCIAGCRAHSGSYRALGSVARGILTMAVRHGIIPLRKAVHVADELQELRRRQNDAVEELGDLAHGGWIIDQDLSMTDPGAAVGVNLAEQFGELMISDEMMTAD